MSNKQFECPRCYKRCVLAARVVRRQPAPEARRGHVARACQHPERECFSDEDSDEEDSDYEEIVIPKKKRTKRKLRANEAASSKRIKPNPKPQLRVPKKLVMRAIPSNQMPKRRPRASIEPPGPPPGAPPSKRLRTQP